MYYADLINADTFLPLTVYTLVALLYLILTIPLSLAVQHMERRFRSAGR
jgi:putative glutamine transport system permease protein